MNLNLGNKGQLSIEFILIVVVILILLQTIVIPFTDYSKDSVSDISGLSYLASSAKNLKEAIEYVTLNDSIAKTQIVIFIPDDANLIVSETEMIYTIILKDPPKNAYCTNSGLCTKEISLKGISNQEGLALLGKKEYLISIFKETNGKTYAEIIE